MLTPHKCAALTVLSNEAVSDSNLSVLDAVGTAMTRAVALACDKAYFDGTGPTNNQPTGILTLNLPWHPQADQIVVAVRQDASVAVSQDAQFSSDGTVARVIARTDVAINDPSGVCGAGIVTAAGTVRAARPQAERRVPQPRRRGRSPRGWPGSPRVGLDQRAVVRPGDELQCGSVYQLRNSAVRGPSWIIVGGGAARPPGCLPHLGAPERWACQWRSLFRELLA